MEEITARTVNEYALPLVIEPKDRNMSQERFRQFLQEERNHLQQQLLQHGGLLFRGFPIKHVVDFETLITTLNLGSFINYIGGDSPRNKVHGGIYTSTEAPPWFRIPLHNELSYVKNYPKHIYFYCEVAPQSAGETIVADARKIYRDIDASVRSEFIQNGLQYVSRYYKQGGMIAALAKGAHKPWMNVFETNDPKEVERKCEENEFFFQWNKNDWLEIKQTCPSILTHYQTNEPVWFNQAHLYDFNPRLLGMMRYLGTQLFYCRKHTKLHEIFFADGRKIPKDALYHVMDVLDRNTIAYPWQTGDVMVLDNVLAMHGRAAFEGKRRVLTAMTG